MQNYIYEDNIERQCCESCIDANHYDHHYCSNNIHQPVVDAWPGRKSMNKVLNMPTLHRKVKQINGAATDKTEDLQDSEVEEAISYLTRYDQLADDKQINRTMMGYLQNGVEVKVMQRNGKRETRTLRFIDYQHPERNEFDVVNQLWIQGEKNILRPDVILYINGIPVVTIELKNASVDVKQAYDDNLTRYKEDLKELMHYNVFLVASNGIETRIGGTYSSWEFFFPWLRLNDGEKVDYKEIEELRSSLSCTIFGLFNKQNLTDYIQNFVMFYNGNKICAKNHQFLGVNRAFERLRQLTENELPQSEHNKGGVFWHTQGSGKSFSMVFLARKVEQLLKGDFTFLVVTDREDLDDQIYRNFLHAGFMKKDYACRPKNSSQLRQMLIDNSRIIFTLIQKFRYDKGRQYPVLSDRNDIIVLVDEAHRTEYKDLAENMRTGLPNARFMAFTGTPLFGSKQMTNKWFGQTLTVYNFNDAIDDGTTVHLTYRNHQPQVENDNPTFDEDFAKILEDDNITEEDRRKLADQYAQQMEVLKRPARLDVIARDIAQHFHSRGYLGKGMVVSVDKFTTVRMYDLVSKYWQEEIQKVNKQLKKLQQHSTEWDELLQRRKWMQETQMAVVVSEEAGEEEKFAAEGLNIKPHRELMNWVDEDTGEELQDRFKKADDPLRLVFVCSMWLTGFDVPTLSTLYLDKPLTGHTLMQAIARANRRTDVTILGQKKTAGELIAYSDIFGQLRKAIKQYGGPKKSDSDDNNTPEPAPNEPKDVEHIYALLKQAIKDCLNWCQQTLDIDLRVIEQKHDTFSKIAEFDLYANAIIAKIEYRRQFYLYDNLIEGLYNEARPDIMQTGNQFDMAKIVSYLRKVIDNNAGKRNLESAKHRIRELLDMSIMPKAAESRYAINDNDAEIDLSQLNLDDVKTAFKQSNIQNVEVEDLERFIQHKLTLMLDENVERVSFSERFQHIIDEYNAGARSSQETLDELLKFVKQMSQEEKRAAREGMTEEQLELFDILKKNKMSKEETVKVKAAAVSLLKSLYSNKEKLFPIDWYKDTQLKTKFLGFIGTQLDHTLPQSYDRRVFTEKRDKVYNVYLVKAMNNNLSFAI
ncbi:MAG: type I restriction endonuclease subunit R [Prevotella sp.]|jgi:type I restriction enzyme R subunit